MILIPVIRSDGLSLCCCCVGVVVVDFYFDNYSLLLVTMYCPKALQSCEKKSLSFVSLAGSLFSVTHVG